MSDEIRSHLRAVVGRIDDDVLPPHYPTCLGCGPDCPQGYHLQVRRDGDDVVAEHVFEERHSGAPGIAHGGAVATVSDIDAAPTRAPASVMVTGNVFEPGLVAEVTDVASE